jgi:hypothetical protein
MIHWRYKEPMTNGLKKDIELAVGQRFLDIYNKRFGYSFEILDTGETPDVYCLDVDSGQKLNIEITILGNLPDDAKKEFERLRGERMTLGTSIGNRGNLDKIWDNIRVQLRKKLLSNYENTPTALVIGRVTTVWSCSDLVVSWRDRIREIVRGKENHYPKGIWIFCADTHGTSDEILNFFDV